MPESAKKRSSAKRRSTGSESAGKLRIGDHWNAITIIALSQSNPLKAVAEFVENAIDARAHRVTIARGRERGSFYLRITDDGDGIPRNSDGVPDFRYVATHICDSIKRRLKAEGAAGVQGEFGIGLLSFWTVGEELTLVSAGADGGTYEMRMSKGSPEYEVTRRRTLIPPEGTVLTVQPLLPGLRQLTGERIQRYLASELRDRIRSSGVRIEVIDRTARATYQVEPRQFSGQLLHDLGTAGAQDGEVYLELYLNPPTDDNEVGLYRNGTRVLAHLAEIEDFDRAPWTSRCLQGLVDAPFLNLTPGSRLGVVRDESYERLRRALEPVERQLDEVLAEQRRAEEEQANRDVLRSVQRALREAFLALPQEEYDWFDVYGVRAGPQREGRAEDAPPPLASTRPGGGSYPPGSAGAAGGEEEEEGAGVDEELQRRFFEFPGPLQSAVISPRSCVVAVGTERPFRAVCRDQRRRLVEADLEFRWEVCEGSGSLNRTDAEMVTFRAPDEPGLVALKVTVRQGDREVIAEAMVTVAEALVPEPAVDRPPRKGLPGYTFQRAPGEIWRSRYDTEQNVIVVNNGHRDFVYASRSRARKLRYICRLFSKELVLHNFPGLPPAQLLERMVELALHTEENLK